MMAPVISAKKPKTKAESVERKAASFVKNIKTFPIRIMASELEDIEKACDKYKINNRNSISKHDWIVEAILEKLQRELK